MGEILMTAALRVYKYNSLTRCVRIQSEYSKKKDTKDRSTRLGVNE